MSTVWVRQLEKICLKYVMAFLKVCISQQCFVKSITTPWIKNICKIFSRQHPMRYICGIVMTIYFWPPTKPEQKSQYDFIRNLFYNFYPTPLSLIFVFTVIFTSRFLEKISHGFPDYSVTFNSQKSISNVDCDESYIPFCGLYINIDLLSVCGNFDAYEGQRISNSLNLRKTQKLGRYVHKSCSFVWFFIPFNLMWFFL